jgi:hypothetical protein
MIVCVGWHNIVGGGANVSQYMLVYWPVPKSAPQLQDYCDHVARSFAWFLAREKPKQYDIKQIDTDLMYGDYDGASLLWKVPEIHVSRYVNQVSIDVCMHVCVYACMYAFRCACNQIW